MILYQLSVTNFQLNLKRTFLPLAVYFNFLNNESHSEDKCLGMEPPHANLLVGIARGV